MTYSSIRVEKGSGGYGGPLIITPTEQKHKFIYITGGGEKPEIVDKISELTLGLDEITGEVSSFYDFTKQVSGINEILLEDALNMNIIRFEAMAKTVKAIYPSKKIYPSKTLYPKKGGTTITLVFARTSRDVVPEPILPSKSLYPSSKLYPRSNGYYKSEFEFYINKHFYKKFSTGFIHINKF